MIALPSWFSRPAPKGKQSAAPPPSATLTQLLAQADADVAEVERREAAAAEREATERSEAAVSHFEDVQLEANRLRRLRDRLRADLESAQAREAAEQRTRELAEADDIADRVCHAGLIAEATERAQRRLDLHLRLAELERDDTKRRRELAALVTRARAARARHGVADSVDDHSHLIGSDIVLADLADEQARTLPMGDARRQYLTDLVHRLAPSQLGAARQSAREARS